MFFLSKHAPKYGDGYGCSRCALLDELINNLGTVCPDITDYSAPNMKALTRRT